jgi:hypothetical protein
VPCYTLPRIDLNRNRNMTTERDVMTEVVEKDSPVTKTVLLQSIIVPIT